MATFSTRVSANGDSGFCNPVPQFGNDFMVLGNDSVNIAHSFARFLSVTIPKDSTILTAVLNVTASSTQSTTTVNGNIYADAADNSTQITSYSDFNGRSLTSAVAWTNIPAETLNTAYDSPDITSIIQAIVNRSGWVSGNAIQLLIKDNSSTSARTRQWFPYQVSSVKAPLLTITYDLPASGFFF